MILKFVSFAYASIGPYLVLCPDLASKARPEVLDERISKKMGSCTLNGTNWS